MKLSEWSSLAEIASSIAILITLVFLVWEVRQNTRALDSATRWSVTEQMNALLAASSGSDESAELYARCQLGDETLSRPRRIRCQLLYGQFLNVARAVYGSEGLSNDTTGVLVNFARYVKQPGIRPFFEATKQELPAELREYLERADD